MAEDLQNLLEKINREGVKKAEAAAAKIIADAQSKAGEIIAQAQAEAAKSKAAAEQAAADFEKRASASVAQAARDVVIETRNALSAILEKLLVQNVERALAEETTACALVAEAIRGLQGPGEIACGEKLTKALAAQLAARQDFTIVTDPMQETGFAVKIESGRVEHDYTAEAVAAEIAKRLRPELAKLVK